MYLPVQTGNSEDPLVTHPEIAIALSPVYRYDYGRGCVSIAALYLFYILISDKEYVFVQH
jgi:hypothetical protein